MSPRQQRFVAEYLVDLCATQAAIRAGYSTRTAEAQGSRLLSNVKVGAAIAEAVCLRSERTGVTQDTVIAGLLGEAQFKGDGATHGARVAGWALGHCNNGLCPARMAAESILLWGFHELRIGRHKWDAGFPFKDVKPQV